MTATVAERVAAGAAFLDEREPGWWQKVDLERISMDSACNCVLGQLSTDRLSRPEQFGDWGQICSAFGLTEGYLGQSSGRLSDTELGFNASSKPGSEDQLSEYVALGAEWTRVILARREASS